MSPTPNLQDLIQSVRSEVADGDPLGQLTKAAELSGELSTLGDRLMDHFVFECRKVGLSWAELSGALGVSKQAAHKRFTGSTPDFQRFTVKARGVVQGAVEQARALGHGTVGSEHLLLAVFEPADSLAAIALARLGVQHQAVLDRVLERKPADSQQPSGAIPFTDHAKGVLRGALDEALDLNHNYIGTEHLLLGMQRDPEFTSAAILTALGHEKAAVRAVLLESLERLILERQTLERAARPTKPE